MSSKTDSKSSRRMKIHEAREAPATRDLLLDAAEALMREEGYAAVTSRRLGDKAGVTSPLIHYYFASMDDLFVALYQRHAEQSLPLLKQSLDSGNVLETLWNQSRNSADAALFLEFAALSNHRKAVRAEMVKYAEQYRSIQYDAIQRFLKDRGLKPTMDPAAAIIFIAGTGLLLGLESSFGMTFGHQKAQELVTAAIAANDRSAYPIVTRRKSK